MLADAYLYRLKSLHKLDYQLIAPGINGWHQLCVVLLVQRLSKLLLSSFLLAAQLGLNTRVLDQINVESVRCERAQHQSNE